MKKHVWDSETECAKFLSNFCEMSGLFKILEVGVWQGATSVYLEKVSSEFVGIDIVNEQIKNDLIKSKTLVGDSIEVMKTLQSNYFDLIFIDTTHEYERTKLELKEAERLIKQNGYIALHDSISHVGVSKWINEIKGNKGLEIITFETPNGNGLTLVKYLYGLC
jgi:predicted O-methyltransferase YrrM